MILNNRFDISKPILESLYEASVKNNGELPDYIFESCCSEYEIEDEEDIFLLMLNSQEYKFTRFSTGWKVKKKQ